jgi:hypothetical protein
VLEVAQAGQLLEAAVGQELFAGGISRGGSFEGCCWPGGCSG